MANVTQHYKLSMILDFMCTYLINVFLFYYYCHLNKYYIAKKYCKGTITSRSCLGATYTYKPFKGTGHL